MEAQIKGKTEIQQKVKTSTGRGTYRNKGVPKYKQNAKK